MAAEVNRSSIYPPNVCMLMVPARSDSRLGKEAELFSQSFFFFFHFLLLLLLLFFFFFLAIPSAYGRSWARDCTHVTVVARATAVSRILTC